MLRSLRLVSLLSLAALAALATGCRDSGGDDTAIDATGSDSTTSGLTIQEVHSDTMVPGSPVELRGKIVVAIDNFGDKKGNFFVAEEGGGEFSGVLVFNAPPAQVALLAVGDKVDISGAEKSEFALTTDTSGRTTTELIPISGGEMTVTKIGTGTVPAAQVIDAAAISAMDAAARDAELEKWEGVLIRVNNVSVLRDLSQITSSMQDDCTFRDFQVTGPLSIDSSLAAIPAALPMTAECPATGETSLVLVRDCLASVTGMGDYFFSHKILPRATGDIALNGTGCPVPQSPTVENVQAGAVTVGTVVSLDDVYVTAVAFNKKNLWVSDSLTAGPNNSIYVFRGSSAALLADTIVAGAQVDVSGTVLEFDGLDGGDTITEIGSSPSVSFVSAPTGPTVPFSGVSVATLLSIPSNESYESALVRLTGIRLTGAIPTAQPFQRQMTDGTTTFQSDDDIVRSMDAVGTCYSSITGVWQYNPFADTNAWVFVPRNNAGDIVIDATGAACP